MPLEFLFLALYFVALAAAARKQGTDGEYLHTLRIWTGMQGALLVVFLVLAFTMTSGFMTPYGALYLASLGLALGVTIRMKETLEGVALTETAS